MYSFFINKLAILYLKIHIYLFFYKNLLELKSLKFWEFFLRNYSIFTEKSKFYVAFIVAMCRFDL